MNDKLSLLLAALGLLMPPLASTLPGQTESYRAFEYTEDRAPCRNYDPYRQPFFGTFHLHTGLSFDAGIRHVRPTPRDAYRFAKGGVISGVDQFGFPTRVYRIDRPLDFGAVTDHSELFGEIGICNDPTAEGRFSLECRLLKAFYWRPGATFSPLAQRTLSSAAFTLLTTPGLGPSTFNANLPLCVNDPETCKEHELSVWQEMQNAAEDAYDRTSECSFTSFVAYENTSTPSGTNWHRNIVFRNANVIERPITAIDMASVKNPNPQEIPPLLYYFPNPRKLWRGLKRQCLDAGNGCDVISITHNSNLGGRFATVPAQLFDPVGLTKRQRARRALLKLEIEGWAEIFQNKGSSECRYDPRFGAGTGTNDEMCDFEILETPTVLTASGVSSAFGSGVGNPPSAFDLRAYLRNVYKFGLLFEIENGVNPFKLGIGASSDNHNAQMGWHPEDPFKEKGAGSSPWSGHLGTEDAQPTRSVSTIQNNSGGHWVIWAEENSRDALFNAMKRKETYGTSGTRPTVRFFGGWRYPEVACERDLVRIGYNRGVPMGGDLRRKPANATAPRFIAAAWMDDVIGTPLQQIQIIKGWVEREGDELVPMERVMTVAGDAHSDATVDPNTCQPIGTGHKDLCTVWEDPDFDPDEHAFYYARVIENPVCRWSTHMCMQRFGINPLLDSCEADLEELAKRDRFAAESAALCCAKVEPGVTEAPYVQRVIQERAWTSPIWYTPRRP